MPKVVSCLIPSAEPRQEPFGDPLLDAYLEFLSGRCRPNSVLAARFDLKVFFAIVDRPVEAVTATDVLGSSLLSAAGRPVFLTRWWVRSTATRSGCRCVRCVADCPRSQGCTRS